MEDVVLRTSGLVKRFGPVVAVDGLDLEVRRGEVFGLLGPNGAGKTTTLRIALGMQRPTSGEVRVLGAAPGTPAALRRIGALVEEPAHYPYLSGLDNLRVVARYAGVARDRLAGALDQVGLTARAGDRVKGYSYGMRQRLGVAAALLKDPELLILDEPTNGLDPASIAAMRDLVRDVGQGERTVILSSHQLGEVEQVCDRVAVVHHGRLVAAAPVSQLRGGDEALVVAEPLARAREVAERLAAEEAGRRAVRGDGAALRVPIAMERIPDLNAALVQAGVRVRELRPVRRSLEDVFFELTGTGPQETPGTRPPEGPPVAGGPEVPR